MAWWPWSEAAFDEARRRDVPVMVSIGYATCHWCHVMARESFADPDIAAVVNERIVAIKVDREEHPDVDAAYLAAASAFTPQLGWPLTVFTTPGGDAFFAGTYFPPRPVAGVPSFRQVLDAVWEAWTQRRDQLDGIAAELRAALTAHAAAPGGDGAAAAIPGPDDLAAAVGRLEALEDREHGGFGTAPKFPLAPVVQFLLEAGTDAAAALARRTLEAMARSGLRDPVDGGFFRYATRRDWTDPHYERMLVDNAQLLRQYAAIGDATTAAGIAAFLLRVLRVPGGFASGQDSESEVDGVRTEGGYYALDATARAAQPAPPLDRKVVTGLNGLAIGALAEAGAVLGHPDWVEAAAHATRELLAAHGDAAPVARASLDGRRSEAVATLEDHASLAGGLLRLALATGDAEPAAIARGLVEACADLRSPAGADPVLAAHGLDLPPERSDGPGPSGFAALADAALLLWGMTGDDRHRGIAERAVAAAAEGAAEHPTGFGGTLGAAARLHRPLEQLVLVHDGTPDEATVALARAWAAPGRMLAVVTATQATALADAGFGLFLGRSTAPGATTAYLCEHFTCRLPVRSASELAALAEVTGDGPPGRLGA